MDHPSVVRLFDFFGWPKERGFTVHAIICSYTQCACRIPAMVFILSFSPAGVPQNVATECLLLPCSTWPMERCASTDIITSRQQPHHPAVSGSSNNNSNNRCLPMVTMATDRGRVGVRGPMWHWWGKVKARVPILHCWGRKDRDRGLGGMMWWLPDRSVSCWLCWWVGMGWSVSGWFCQWVWVVLLVGGSVGGWFCQWVGVGGSFDGWMCKCGWRVIETWSQQCRSLALLQILNNNNGYFEHLTCTGPKHLQIIFNNTQIDNNDSKVTHTYTHMHAHMYTHIHLRAVGLKKRFLKRKRFSANQHCPSPILVCVNECSCVTYSHSCLNNIVCVNMCMIS